MSSCNNQTGKSNIWIMFLMFFAIALFITIDFIKTNSIMDYLHNNPGPYFTGNIYTGQYGTGNYGTGLYFSGNINPSDVESVQSKILIENQEGYQMLSLSKFPKIKVNKPISNVYLTAEVTFTKQFVNRYRYEDSKGYYFALNFFIGNFQNGGYYKVYRNQQGGVGNSKKQGLDGAKLAYLVNEGVIRDIPLNNRVPVAVKRENWSPTNQFRYLKIEDYINSHIGEELPIGAFLSSTAEVQGYELTRIISLKLRYFGQEDDVEIIQPTN